jgi:predicted nucleic acid-binding protein
MGVPAKPVVIDASVVLKWVFDDEEEVDAAVNLLKDYEASALILHAPKLLGYEVSNALWAAVRQQRLTEQEAEEALDAIRAVSFAWHHLTTIWTTSMELALRHERTFYDSVYMALAQHLRVPLFTGDRRLYHAVSDSFRWTRWIGDYNWDSVDAATVG